MSLQAKQIKRSQERVERMSRLKEVAVGDHTEEDVERALAKITEVRRRDDATGQSVGRGTSSSSLILRSADERQTSNPSEISSTYAYTIHGGDGGALRVHRTPCRAVAGVLHAGLGERTGGEKGVLKLTPQNLFPP